MIIRRLTTVTFRIRDKVVNLMLFYLAGATVGYKSLGPHAVQMFFFVPKPIYFHRQLVGVLRLRVIVGFYRTRMSDDAVLENNQKQYC